jgi:glycosyltransferase involved in cell wall biosynthesis
MRILYISPEHISGTLPLFCRGHRKRGNEARYVTLFPTRFGFPEDLTLNLPFHPDKKWIIKGRKLLRKIRGLEPDHQPEGTPPFWEPGSYAEKIFFKYRDSLIKKRVYSFIEMNRIREYDVFHLEQGMEFFRDSRAMKEFKLQGKKIVCFYHGTDVRNRGVLKDIHEISDLNLTSELDLIEKYPGIKYLFLPIDTDEVVPTPQHNTKIRVAHATRSRKNKGTDYILSIVKKLEKKLPVEMVLIEDKPHDICMEIKSTCDIYIDQIADKGGWGYGMSSVESLAQGLAVCTFLNQKYMDFIPDHPFINVNYENLEFELSKLIMDEAYRSETAKRGREWVIKMHGIKYVMDALYKYYKEAGITE